APLAIALSLLIRDPAKMRRLAAFTIRGFARAVFDETWREIEPRLKASAADTRVRLGLADWDSIGHRLGLNVEFDQAKKCLRALRGGYRLPFNDMESANFLPSVFNEGRFWTVLEDAKGEHAYLPYLIDDGRPVEPRTGDAALIFRALGDATRFAIARLIARR